MSPKKHQVTRNVVKKVSASHGWVPSSAAMLLAVIGVFWVFHHLFGWANDNTNIAIAYATVLYADLWRSTRR